MDRGMVCSLLFTAIIFRDLYGEFGAWHTVLEICYAACIVIERI